MLVGRRVKPNLINPGSSSIISINYIKRAKRLRNSAFDLVKFWTHAIATKKYIVSYLFRGFGLVNLVT